MSFAVTAPGRRPSRSVAGATSDLLSGLRQRELWAHLGWQDVKQRYRRSALGPFWITVSMAVMAIGLGILYSALLGTPIATLLPSVLVGFIIWNFLSGCVMDGTDTFIANEGLIRHVPSPMSVYTFRTVWRQALFFGHNFVVYGLMFAIYPQHLTWTALLFFPAFLLLLANGVWMAMLLGIVSTRFRDVPPIVGSLMQLAFYVTPIVWQYQTLRNNRAVGGRAKIAMINPFLHYVEFIREPLLGEPIVALHWAVVLGCTIAGWVVTLLFFRNYRARIAYWV